jgi:PadR family transcriptional regulator, regulatory protein PadR
VREERTGEKPDVVHPAGDEGSRRLDPAADTAGTPMLQGTLDLMVLKTLESMGPQHGYGIARRIEQISEQALRLNQGTIYPALLRLRQRGWIRAEWGTSENGRRARYYSLTKSGKAQIEKETESWERVAATMARFLAVSEGH